MIEKSRRKKFNTLKKNSYEYYHKKSYKNSKYSYTKIKILELDDSNYFTNKQQSFDYSNSENKENIIDYSNQNKTLPSTENKNYKIKNIKKHNINNNINNNICNSINNLDLEKNNQNIESESKNTNYKTELNDNMNNNNLSQSEYSDEFSENFENDNDDNDDKINENNNNNLLNISTQEIKDAYYYPKKLQFVKNMFFSQKIMQFNLLNNFINNNNSINRVNSMNENILYKNNSFFNSDSLENKLSINNNNSNFILSPIQNNNNKNNINLFNLYESNIIPSNSNSTTLIPSLNLNKTINNVFIGNSYYDTNTINNCITNNSMEFYHKKEKEKENTDILCINIKINNNELLVFKIRRYDDMFKTVKIFCEINKLDTKYIKPLIIYIIRALNSIYGIYNLSLNENEIKFIEDLRERELTKNELNVKNSSNENNNYLNDIDFKTNENEKICKN